MINENEYNGRYVVFFCTMKKIIFSLLFLIVSSFSIPFLSSSPTKIHAVSASDTVQVSPSPVPVPTTPKVEYILPYPGILPTHPLYFLKTIRDQIVEALISDPIKKADFYITQADKKLSMALALADMKKTQEMKQALIDAQTLRQKSVSQLEGIKTAKQEVPGYILDQLSRSLTKHIEILTALKQDVVVLQGFVNRSVVLMGGK